MIEILAAFGPEDCDTALQTKHSCELFGTITDDDMHPIDQLARHLHHPSVISTYESVLSLLESVSSPKASV